MRWLFQKSDEELDFNLKALSRKFKTKIKKLSQKEAKKPFKNYETQLKIKSRDTMNSWVIVDLLLRVK